MKDYCGMLQYLFAGLGGVLGWFLGDLDGFLYALIAFAVVDYVTGVILAVMERKLSSGVGFRGIVKKVVIFCVVGIANILDVYIVKSGSALRTAVLFFYLTNEGISILENAASMGIPVPSRLKDVLIQLKEDKPDDGK